MLFRKARGKPFGSGRDIGPGDVETRRASVIGFLNRFLFAAFGMVEQKLSSVLASAGFIFSSLLRVSRFERDDMGEAMEIVLRHWRAR